MINKFKGPRETERLVIKNASGRFAKFKPDRKLYYYYYDSSKPVGKRYRPLYREKNGEASPRRLTSTQLRFLTARRRSAVGSRPIGSYKFTIVSTEWIMDQVFQHKVPLLAMIRGHLKTKKLVFVYVIVKFPNGVRVISPTVAIGRDWSDDAILKAIARGLIVDPMKAVQVRMSPKTENNEKAEHQETAVVEVIIAKYN